MENKILILGAGYIGRRLAEGLGCELTDKRILTYKDIEEELKKYSPAIIVNCIGGSGRNVDDCERDLDKTLVSNTFVPLILAEAAVRNKIKLIHISTGCIYHYNYAKDSAITEEKTPDFFDLFYSRTKIYSDQALVVLSREYPFLIIRLRVPLDDRPHPKNLLTKLINYKKAINLSNSVTYIPDFIKAVQHLIDIDAKGIYHVANKGGLVYADLLDVYKKYVPDFKYEVLDFQKLNLVRTNLILSTEKLEKSGFKVRNISEVLEECVRNYLKY